MINPYWEPTKYEDGWWNLWGLLTPLQHESDGRNLGGSWNIAFVREDAGKRGTISHELAHSLGQGREFYEDYEKCQQFRKDPLEPCVDYKIPLALDADDQSWKLIENKFSIVNYTENIDNEWIDRDTYQKTFQVLSRFISPAIDPWVDLQGDSSSSSLLKDKKSSLKAVVSGFYYEKEDAFIVPKTRVYKTSLQTTSFDQKTKKPKLPLITFQLKEKGKVLKEVKRIALKTKIESLYENGSSKTRPFPFSHVMAVFELSENYPERNLRIVILDPKENVIYSAPLLKKVTENGTKKTTNDLVQIDKNY